jgi:HAD superfamily hydrolase (TIGR01509 family)
VAYDISPWLIDLDGTLIESISAWDSCHRLVAGHYGGTWPPRPQPENSGTFAWIQAALRGVDCDVKAASTEVDAMITKYFKERGFILQPGADELLEKLNSTGVPCVLVTAGPQSVAKLFTDWLSTGLFIFTVSDDDVTSPKPAAEPYLLAAHLLETEPADCIAVEDSLIGVTSALAAEVGTVIGVGPQHLELHKLGTAISFSSLADLASLILEKEVVTLTGRKS